MEETKKVEEVKEKEETLYNDEYDDKTMLDEEFFSPGKKKPRRKRKIIQNLKCPLCEAGVKSVGYKDVYQLKKFTSVRGKIVSTEKSGVCHKHQKQLQTAIKRARYMALLPYVSNE
ncbi:MAG TPA: 30S ribosomal protein S18 [Candidatus Dojkabacteria bacterium]|nr:30S ribosomal protein S18 [Candidatus Dojkabacteria bacterium]